jgi:hypothetical protein
VEPQGAIINDDVTLSVDAISVGPVGVREDDLWGRLRERDGFLL